MLEFEVEIERYKRMQEIVIEHGIKYHCNVFPDNVYKVIDDAKYQLFLCEIYESKDLNVFNGDEVIPVWCPV